MLACPLTRSHQVSKSFHKLEAQVLKYVIQLRNAWNKTYEQDYKENNSSLEHPLIMMGLARRPL